MPAPTHRFAVLWKLRPLIAPLLVAIVTGGLLWWFLPPAPRWSKKVPPLDTTIVFAPDSQAFIYGTRPQLWDTETGRELLNGPQGLPPDADQLRFCADGSLLYVAGERDPDPTSRCEFVRFDRRTGQRDVVYRWASAESPLDQAFSQDGRWLALGHSRPGACKLVIIDLNLGRVLHELDLERGEPRGFAPDGNTLVFFTQTSEGTRRGSLVLLDVATGARRCAIPTQNNEPNVFWAFTPDGRSLLVAVEKEGLAEVEELELWDARNGTLLRRLSIRKTTSNGLEATPDNKHVLVTRGGLDVYDLASLELRFKLPTSVRSHRVSRDGRWLAASVMEPSDAEPHLRVYNLATGEQVADLGSPTLPTSAPGPHLAFPSPSVNAWDQQTPATEVAAHGWNPVISHADPFLADSGLLVAEECSRSSHPLARKIGEWLGTPGLGAESVTTRLVFAEVQGGRRRAELITAVHSANQWSSFAGDYHHAFLAPDGKSVLVYTNVDEHPLLRCWDVLPRTPWERILAGALAAVVLVLLTGRGWGWLCARWRRRAVGAGS